jgi:hypothetical protein
MKLMVRRGKPRLYTIFFYRLPQGSPSGMANFTLDFSLKT